LGTQGSFSKNFQPTCGSHSLMCTDVWIMNELSLNYEWTKI
jgi:hypothetical protein